MIVSVQGCDVDQVALTYHLWIPVFHLPKIGPLSTPDSCALRRIVHEVALCDNARWIKNRHSKVWWQIYMGAFMNYGARLWCNVWQSDETNATIRNLLDSFKARDTAWWWTYWLICTKLARMWNRLAIPCVTSICDPIILRLGYWGRISCEHRNGMQSLCFKRKNKSPSQFHHQNPFFYVCMYVVVRNFHYLKNDVCEESTPIRPIPTRGTLPWRLLWRGWLPS